MTDTITLTGLVATVPHVVSSDDRVPFTSFRLASNQRYFDRRTSEWVAGETNWYTVTAFRALAVNAGTSVHKGDRVLVTGRLKVRRWESGEKTGTSVDVEADSIGHDLVWGTAHYVRTIQREPAPADGSVEEGRSGAPDAAGQEAVGEQASVGPGGAERTETWAAAAPGSAAGGFGASAQATDTPF